MVKILEKKDKKRIKISDLLKSYRDGLTIQDIMDKTGLARHTVLARLHRLVGEKKVRVRQVNMAKLHFWDDYYSSELLPKDEAEIAAYKELEMRELKKENIKKAPITDEKKPNKSKIDFEKIKGEIQKELLGGGINNNQAQIKTQREPITHVVRKSIHPTKKTADEYIKTGIVGFDELLEDGIPKGSSVLIAGGAGSGKTIFTLQTMFHHASHGEKCLYMSFEESEERLIHHMEDFGWNPRPLIKKGNILIKRFNPFDITRSVDALLMKAKGELLIDVEPVIFPEDFKPNLIVVDSLTAIASAFTGKLDSYRIYIEQLFRFFEKINAVSLLITETEQIPKIYSKTGVEEFLADGVVVFYNIKRGNIRENAIEVLKLRGAKHQKKIVAMQITNNGVVVYPEQEVFGGIESV